MRLSRTTWRYCVAWSATRSPSGRLPTDALVAIDIRSIPPSLAVRDRLKDAQADQILVRNGAMSVATMAMRSGLDPEQEERLIGSRKSLEQVSA